MNDAEPEWFGRRVAKNLRHLGRWARREGHTCFRVYDRDIPEVPLTLDWYDGSAVLNDYRRDYDDRDPTAAARWLELAVAHAATALGVEPARVFVKQRQRMAGRHEDGRQYERLAEQGAWHEVREAGHRFRVNLSDYVDTGLFLDHRLARARVGAESAGRRVLNLFCYTGAFTVYAAAGGAAESLSVDLSHTYLDWAADNLRLNGADPARHRLRHGDVRVVLGELAATGARFDLAVVDPPTFSVSKRMDGTFDVLRDHPALLAAVGEVLAPGGVIWFSTNHRRFRLALPARLAPRWRVTDETAATIPPDFRDRSIHRAWRIAT